MKFIIFDSEIVGFLANTKAKASHMLVFTLIGSKWTSKPWR